MPVYWLTVCGRSGSRSAVAHIARSTVLLLVAFVLVGCTQPATTDQQRGVSLEPAEAEVKVAAVWPYTSHRTFFWEGVQLALEEVNARGGAAGRRLRVVKVDDQSSVTEGMAVAQTLAEDNELLAVIGHRNSFVALPAAEVYDRAGLIYIAPSATSPALTQRGYERTFRTIPSDTSIGRQMAAYVATAGHQRVAIAYTDDAYGRGLADAFEDAAEARGVRIVDRVAHFGDVTDVRRTLAKWAAFEYDSIFVAATSPQLAEIVSLVRRAGSTVPIFGGDAFDSVQFLQVAGSYSEGVVFASVFDADHTDVEIRRFVEAFTARFGFGPDTWAAQGYDALHVLADAVEQAGTVSPEAVAAALRATTRWRGVTGWHTFDESGEVIDKPIVYKTVRDGEFALLDGPRMGDGGGR